NLDHFPGKAMDELLFGADKPARDRIQGLVAGSKKLRPDDTLRDLRHLRDGDLLLRAGRRTTARLSDLTGLASDFGSRRLAPELEILRGGAATLIRYQLD
ncbi:MAG: hypothetical protein MJ061_04305, partial [Mailhella sp.]|nr:hypothetical protein [Mailhella sp.]